jgi:hypothetical protein
MHLSLGQDGHVDKSPQTRNSGSHRSGLGPWRAIHRRSWTTKAICRMPSRFAGAEYAPSRRLVWNLVSSSFSLPSGVFTTTSSARTSSRPTTLLPTRPRSDPSLAVESQVEEERGRSLNVVDDDNYVIETVHAYAVDAKWASVRSRPRQRRPEASRPDLRRTSPRRPPNGHVGPIGRAQSTYQCRTCR